MREITSLLSGNQDKSRNFYEALYALFNKCHEESSPELDSDAEVAVYYIQQCPNNISSDFQSNLRILERTGRLPTINLLAVGMKGAVALNTVFSDMKKQSDRMYQSESAWDDLYYIFSSIDDEARRYGHDNVRTSNFAASQASRSSSRGSSFFSGRGCGGCGGCGGGGAD